ncbi:MAG TPA: energy transducer TonB [Gemmatirosa sp.]
MRIPPAVAPVPGDSAAPEMAVCRPRPRAALPAAVLLGALVLGAAVTDPICAQARPRGGTVAAPAPVRAARPESTYYGFEVDTLAEPDPATMVPTYPPVLKAQGVGGTVVVKFVVDTMGRVDMRTFRVLRTDDTAFTRAVRATVARAEFLPALLDGRKVRQYVEQPFTFAVDVVTRPRLGVPAAGAPRAGAAGAPPR